MPSIPRTTLLLAPAALIPHRFLPQVPPARCPCASNGLGRRAAAFPMLRTSVRTFRAPLSAFGLECPGPTHPPGPTLKIDHNPAPMRPAQLGRLFLATDRMVPSYLDVAARRESRNPKSAPSPGPSLARSCVSELLGPGAPHAFSCRQARLGAVNNHPPRLPPQAAGPVLMTSDRTGDQDGRRGECLDPREHTPAPERGRAGCRSALAPFEVRLGRPMRGLIPIPGGVSPRSSRPRPGLGPARASCIVPGPSSTSAPASWPGASGGERAAPRPMTVLRGHGLWCLLPKRWATQSYRTTRGGGPAHGLAAASAVVVTPPAGNHAAHPRRNALFSLTGERPRRPSTATLELAQPASAASSSSCPTRSNAASLLPPPRRKLELRPCLPHALGQHSPAPRSAPPPGPHHAQKDAPRLLLSRASPMRGAAPSMPAGFKSRGNLLPPPRSAAAASGCVKPPRARRGVSGGFIPGPGIAKRVGALRARTCGELNSNTRGRAIYLSCPLLARQSAAR